MDKVFNNLAWVNSDKGMWVSLALVLLGLLILLFGAAVLGGANIENDLFGKLVIPVGALMIAVPTIAKVLVEGKKLSDARKTTEKSDIEMQNLAESPVPPVTEL